LGLDGHPAPQLSRLIAGRGKKLSRSRTCGNVLQNLPQQIKTLGVYPRMNVGIQDGLIDPKHERAMGQAIWIFLWCVRCQTQRTNFVLGGMPLTYDEISRRSGFPARRIRRWIDRLRRSNYVKVTHLNFCMLRIEIMKSKKWFPKQIELPLNLSRPQTVNLSRPEVVNTATKNGQPKQSCSLREKSKTPLPPASGGLSSEVFLDYYGSTIAIQMGHRKRLPVNSEGRMRDQEYAEWLTRKGFPARLVEMEERAVN